jgi:hypothetical protein
MINKFDLNIQIHKIFKTNRRLRTFRLAATEYIFL